MGLVIPGASNAEASANAVSEESSSPGYEYFSL
jgi:hypothetical protein